MVNTNDADAIYNNGRNYGLNEFLYDINRLKDESDKLEQIDVIRNKWLHDDMSAELAMREIQYIMTK
jgi:hypothetical protein